MKTLVAALCLIAPAPALACFGAVGETLFHCTFKGGRSEARVCLQDGAAYYAFGPKGSAPEVVLARDVAAVGMAPWPGIGRTIWEEVAFGNGAYGYRLSYAIDKMAPNEPVVGTLVVTRNGEEISALTCDRGSVSAHDFYPLFEAKEAAGACFTPGQGWSRSCN
ncbi:MAG: hypothetical protein EP318_13925 [Rhodobacteraceae bacterium]|nr:MAG: hypothetical protein EP318_13925 [Paracoccaceae bacterium]